ncbi:MAG: hypothetical protein ISR53_06185 [Rhodospirillales bacterium]|nr:hypothetical protein [Rhodospirillales bacterium]
MRQRFLKRWCWLLLLIPALVFMGSHAAFAAPRCPPPEQPARLNIKTAPAKVIYKTGHSRSDLERMQRARGRHQGAGKWRVLGLTLTEFRYAIKTSARLIPISGGGYCAQPVSYDLTIGFSDFLVHIDRQYRRGSCEFAAIRDHEISHVTLFRSNLSRYMPIIRREARNAAASVRSVTVRDPDSGAERLQDQMQRRMNPLISKLNREADSSNARIDTPDSYRHVHMLCDNW